MEDQESVWILRYIYQVEGGNYDNINRSTVTDTCDSNSQ